MKIMWISREVNSREIHMKNFTWISPHTNFTSHEFHMIFSDETSREFNVSHNWLCSYSKSMTNSWKRFKNWETGRLTLKSITIEQFNLRIQNLQQNVISINGIELGHAACFSTKNVLCCFYNICCNTYYAMGNI